MAKRVPATASLNDKADGDFTLRALRMFVAVEEAGSMALAAERLNASPSAISQQITGLEKITGVALFDRKQRPMSLTPAGQLLSRHARRILDAVSDAKAELSEMNLRALPRLRLAFIDDLDLLATPALVAGLRKDFADTFFSVTSGNSLYVTAALSNRQADIVLSTQLPEDENMYTVLPVLSEPFMLVAAKGTLDANEDLLAQLTEQPFVQCTTSLPMGRRVAQQLRRVRLNPPEQFAFEASRTVMSVVCENQGWTLLTPLSILDSERFLPDVDVMELPFPAFSRTIYVIARRDELGGLPADIAVRTKKMIDTHIAPKVFDFAPWARDSFYTFGIE